MTMYGVVVCPRCKRAKGVDLKQKTTTCLCGFEIRVVPSRVRARANTARELAPLVGQVSAEIAGGLKAYREAAAPVRRIRPRDVHLRVIGIAASGVVVSAWLSRDTLYVPETLGLLLVLSVSLGLVNADTGSLIGFGASRKQMWPSFLRAIAVRFAHAAFLFPFILSVDEPFSAISAATSAGFALLVYYYVYHRILPGTLPEDLRRELRRDRRRALTPRG